MAEERIGGIKMLTVDEIIRKLEPVFAQNGVVKAILFGSYAKGEATENSDIDLVIETEAYIKGWDFFAIAGYSEEALGKSVGLFGAEEIIPNGRLENEVLATGRLIYEKIRP